MSYIQGTDRDQLCLPTCLEDMISADNPVRVIDAFVDMLDMEALGFSKYKPAYTGRPAYDPKDLLKLYLYGYFFSIRSSRRLMRECRRNIELMYLLRGLKPDFRTIADLRKENSEAIRGAFVELIHFCAFLDLYDTSEDIAIDGSKFRAVNANKKMYNQEILDKKCERIQKKLDAYMDELAQADEREDTLEKTNHNDPRTLEEKIDVLKKRKNLYTEWKEELLNSGEKQKLTTDSDARMMHTTKDGYHCCYNVQTAVSAESKLIVDYQVTNHVNDQGILHNFGNQVKETTCSETIHVIADKGYDSNDEILSCLNDGIIADVGFRSDKNEKLISIPFVPVSIDEKVQKSGEPENIRKCLQAGVLPQCYENTNLSIEVHTIGKIGAFLRNDDKSYVMCPMGKRIGKVKERRGGMVYKSRTACRSCENRCTASVKTKEVYFGPNTNCVAAKMYGEKPAVNTPPPDFVPTNSFYKKDPIKKTVILRIKEDPDKQRQRLCISEHPFGTVKWHHGAYFVLCRGLRKTTAELGLSFTAYNLRRMINMKGTEELIKAMRGV